MEESLGSAGKPASHSTRPTRTTPEKAKNDALEDLRVAGFECVVAEPDLLVFQPSRSRSREQIRDLSLLALFLLLFAAGPMFGWLNMIGVLHSPSSSSVPDSFIVQALFFAFVSALALGPLAVALLALYTLLHDELWHRYTPITLDRGSDRVLYGKKVACALSSIQRVVLRRIYQTGPSRLPLYGVSLELKTGRRVPRRLLPKPYLRYFVGRQQPGQVEQVISQIAAFIGAEFYLSSEIYSSGCSKGM